MAFPIAVVHGGAAVLVDGGRWAAEAVLPVDLALLQFLVWWLAVLVFSGDVARHSIQWDNFLLTIYCGRKMRLGEKLGWHISRHGDRWVVGSVRVLDEVRMVGQIRGQVMGWRHG